MKNHYIAGQWHDSTEAAISINPSDTNDAIGHYAQASAAQATEAITAAHAAAPEWARSTPQQRADALDRIGSEILARREDLGRLLSSEEGKTLPEGIGEVTRAGNIFKYFAGEALRLRGDKLASVRPGVEIEVTREPVGVVGIIAPWNFPMAIPAWKIAPALAFGNAVVFKPAEIVPGCAWALAEIISRAGLPPGTFNLVMGRGAEVGRVLLDDRRVDAISFTGSVATGRRVAQAAAQRMAKVQLEMGGKNPMVVLNDADIDIAVDCAVQSAFFSTGQRCTASSRLIVEEGVYAAFVSKLQQRTAGLRIGHALEAGTDIGPVASAEQLAQDLRYVAIGQEEGARLLCGGDQVSRKAPGYYLTPAVFVDCSNEMRICREEIFGPVATVIPARDYEHALALSNDTEFGLAAGICSTSLKYVQHFKRHAQAGMVMVNVPTAGVDYHVPFGGRKASSLGAREQGSYAAEFYTTVKTAYIAG
ncbi:Aldehyde dehydrogenase, thermostable [Cupriavidus yeoncheonensis]|uniref:Aldehyde dehydrogenase, thermostable n=1 Tax=Cupriavidus yeoncheonensis TaxID=1462994 RepID=A0A916J0A3_9BURK|nr:aldehyde dehydrogenase family protein [Cupriavidus yeoncheonensis]CAG2155231.1 Aldehyde dehydrogenase, thermostable [Cupriavidus yeoncheonensis]